MMLPAPYDDIAAEWDGVRGGFRGGEKRYVDLLIDGVLPGSTLLDLGCGSGRPNAAYLAAGGYAVVGVDRSARLLRMARAYVPGGRWIQAEMVSVELAGGFAGVICWDAIFHVQRMHHRAIVQKVFRWLKPGGRFVLSCGGSSDEIPAFTDTMFGRTFFYDAWPKEQMVRLVAEAGFEIVLAEMIDLPDGARNKGKLGIVARKPLGCR